MRRTSSSTSGLSFGSSDTPGGYTACAGTQPRSSEWSGGLLENPTQIGVEPLSLCDSFGEAWGEADCQLADHRGHREVGDGEAVANEILAVRQAGFKRVEMTVESS